jgi:uncharacterized protein (DUF2252 family)
MTSWPGHLSLPERVARGERAREQTAPSSHQGWAAAPDRADPVALIEEQNARREQDLVPVRHARMAASPFTFYRGAAAVMAEDLAATPRAGLVVQLCGDAHLSNFGMFASPERNLVFDVTDFDETLPGPFEYDVKRLAASVAVAARNNGFRKSETRVTTTECVRAYREAMGEFASMGTLEVWYSHTSEADLDEAARLLARRKSGKGSSPQGTKASKKFSKQVRAELKRARRRDSTHALSKMAEKVDGRYRIESDPPTVVPARELHLLTGSSVEELDETLKTQFRRYRSSLAPHRRELLDRYEVVDWARKVVGVGSVGTRAFIALLQGRDDTDPLFLQAKEATTSVLEGHLPRSRYRRPGERVVNGQRLMQATPDIFLGSTKDNQAGRYLYWRQLRDMKGSMVVEQLSPTGLTFYARMCGWTLARAHARSGDPVAIDACLGGDDDFDFAVADFARRYADQNDRDFAAFTEAIRTGRITAHE